MVPAVRACRGRQDFNVEPSSIRYPKRSQNKCAESPYRIRNWAEYEAGQRDRGDLTVWLSDSTGLRIPVGHLRNPPKRRVWRKLHPAVNAETGEVIAAELTNRRTADCARVPGLLDQIDDLVASVTVDGAYDAGAVYEAAKK